MNKFVIVLGVAAAATFTGCKDPSFKRSGSPAADEAHVIATEPAPAVAAETDKAAEPVVVEKKGCLCPPGTKHTQPCGCGAPDCKCIVETKAAPLPPPEPEYATYVVQSGDYLAKISRKFNVTIAAIKNANALKSDMIRIGQKLKIPGVDASAVPAVKPAKAQFARPASASKQFKAYTGATKEYVVKSGDTLGAIAYGNGINIRQLKAMNSLVDDRLRVGQKLKIPASAKKEEKPAARKPAVVEKEAEAVPEADDKKTAEVEEPVAGNSAASVTNSPAAPVSSGAEPKSASTFTYKVGEGEDITAITIRFAVSAAEIRELNNLADDAQLTPGQVIKLPAEVQQ